MGTAHRIVGVVFNATTELARSALEEIWESYGLH